MLLLATACTATRGADEPPTPGWRLGAGKLLLTGGVASVDGAAGGGLTPWAVTASHATQGEIGFTAHLTRAATQDYALNAYGLAAGLDDRVELSLAQQAFDAGAVVPDITLRLTVAGFKWRLAGDAVLDSDTLLPQAAVGAQYKRLQPGVAVGAVLDSVGARREGLDLYASATKLFLAQGVLASATLRATRANQNGLLGFGSAQHGRYRLQPEFSVAWLARRDLAFGAEYRTKPDNLAFAGAAFREDDWKDLFAVWAPGKQLSITLAYVSLGNIVGHARQHGGYLSLQFGL
jgi:hypothetical protein